MFSFSAIRFRKFRLCFTGFHFVYYNCFYRLNYACFIFNQLDILTLRNTVVLFPQLRCCDRVKLGLKSQPVFIAESVQYRTSFRIILQYDSVYISQIILALHLDPADFFRAEQLLESGQEIDSGPANMSDEEFSCGVVKGESEDRQRPNFVSGSWQQKPDSWENLWWPNATVYYNFTDNFSFRVRIALGLAILMLENRSCVK